MHTDIDSNSTAEDHSGTAMYKKVLQSNRLINDDGFLDFRYQARRENSNISLPSKFRYVILLFFIFILKAAHII